MVQVEGIRTFISQWRYSSQDKALLPTVYHHGHSLFPTCKINFISSTEYALR